MRYAAFALLITHVVNTEIYPFVLVGNQSCLEATRPLAETPLTDGDISRYMESGEAAHIDVSGFQDRDAAMWNKSGPENGGDLWMGDADDIAWLSSMPFVTDLDRHQ